MAVTTIKVKGVLPINGVNWKLGKCLFFKDHKRRWRRILISRIVTHHSHHVRTGIMLKYGITQLPKSKK